MTDDNEPRLILVRNAARCEGCGDEIESVYRHDFRWCKCGNLGVDGGLAYTKRSVGDKPWTDLSEWAAP